MKRRTVETFRASFKRDSFIVKDKVPRTLPHLTPGFTLEAIEIKAVGSLFWNGTPMEFQDVRLYIKPAPWRHYREDLASPQRVCLECGRPRSEHETTGERCPPALPAAERGA